MEGRTSTGVIKQAPPGSWLSLTCAVLSGPVLSFALELLILVSSVLFVGPWKGGKGHRGRRGPLPIRRVGLCRVVK